MADKKQSTLSKILKYIGRYKLLMLLSALLAIGIVFLTLYVPILIGDAIDLIAYGEGAVPIDGIISLLFTAGVMIIITAILQWLMASINNRITYHITKDMRNDGFSKLQRLPVSFIDTQPKGDVVNRIISDVDQFAEGLLLGFTQLFTGALTIVGTMAFMLVIDWKIALVVLILTPLSLFIAKFIGTKTHSMFTDRSKCSAEQTSHIDEMLGNQKVIVAFAHQDKALEEFDEINERLKKSSLKAIFFSSLVNPTTRFVNNVVYAAVALTGALSAVFTMGSASPFTIGMLTCLLSYTNQYTKPFNEISGVITEFQNALACAGRFFELVEEEDEIADTANGQIPENLEGHVDFKNVCFSYTEDKPLIENLSLTVESGKRVAIVGPTGCGKTTLINLLMRFYDTKGGEISVDGIPITNLPRHTLRKNYGIVLQDTWLKSGTIKENIAIGRPDATDEEIIAAAKATHAHSFIKRLKDGYDTVIGESSSDLSQGQRQLLSITRVMLCLPPMLILDEATSSIDTRTEIKIQSAFSEMMKGRTVFIVAHRLSTVKDADIILVMKDGNIIETGTHEELLSAGGFYRTLYDSQFAH